MHHERLKKWLLGRIYRRIETRSASEGCGLAWPYKTTFGFTELPTIASADGPDFSGVAPLGTSPQPSAWFWATLPERTRAVSGCVRVHKSVRMTQYGVNASNLTSGLCLDEAPSVTIKRDTSACSSTKRKHQARHFGQLGDQA